MEKANNNYMRNYDDKAPWKYIMYLYANNLYSWVMSQYIPTGGFKWFIEKAINKVNLAEYTEVGGKRIDSWSWSWVST